MKACEVKEKEMNKDTVVRVTLLVVAMVLIMFGTSEAANRLTGNPVFIDTPASGDVTISSKRVWIQNITVTAYTSAKTVTFIDADDNVVLVVECPTGSSISWPPVPCSDKGCEFPNGLYLDDSATDLANSSDLIFIWKSK
jgi:hypothetical protein